jgi:hypothetical protein
MENVQKTSKLYLSITKGAIHTLLALFILGMFANLYIEFPAGLSNGEAWKWVFSSSAVIAIHAVLGTLLLLVSITSLVMAIKTHRKVFIVSSSLGLVFTMLAAYAGSDFVGSGQTSFSSMLMALGFLGALVSYAYAVFQTRLVA